MTVMDYVEYVEPQVISAERIANAVNLVNDFRRACGIEPLDDLPKGEKRNIYRCIFAKAFNFDCYFSPGQSGHGGHVGFKSGNKDQAEKLATLLGESVIKVGDEDFTYKVYVPDYISEIAYAFDKCLLPQYDVSI